MNFDDFKKGVNKEVAKLEAIGERKPDLPADESLLNPLLYKAVVRPTFTVDEILADIGESEESVSPAEVKRQAVRLLELSYTAESQEENSGWQLRPEIKAKIIRQLNEKISLADYLPPQWRVASNIVQKLIGEYLTGTAPSIYKQSLEELTATLQIEPWLKFLKSVDFPKRNEVQNERELRELTAPFEALTRNFSGRTAELDVLRQYVELLPSQGFLESAHRAVRSALDLTDKPPLMITGLGGIGKTTLLAEFILRHLHFASEDDESKSHHTRLPFVYLDFDKVQVSVREPLTLLTESVRQLSIQFHGKRYGSDWEALYEDLKGESLFGRQDMSPNSSSNSSHGMQPYMERLWLQKFGDLWTRIYDERKTPLLVVLDSFEEVQRRLGTSLIDLFGFLNDWRAVAPKLRIVISGRWPIKEITPFFHQPMEVLLLGNFDEAAALGYLKTCGLENPDLRMRVFDRFKGNPLTLRLAAAVVIRSKDQIDATKSIRIYDWLFRRIEEEQVQQQLFRRNISHISDPVAQKVAMPGLIVRRLTAEIIQRVLAGPCGLKDVTAERSVEILQILEREPNIIEIDLSGVAQYRQDLRKQMIPLITVAEPEKVRQIHDLAVKFYAGRPDAADRAEWIYHRLARGDSMHQLEEHLTPDLQPFLEGSLEELPPSASVALAGKLGMTIPWERLLLANVEAFEVSAIKEIQEALSSNRFEALLQSRALLHQKTDRTLNSRLRRIECQIYERLGEFEIAKPLAEVSMKEAATVCDYQSEAEMSTLLGRLHERLFKWSTAASYYRRAFSLSLKMGNTQAWSETLIALVRLAKRRNHDPARLFSRLYKLGSQSINIRFENFAASKQSNPSIWPAVTASESSSPQEFLWNSCKTDNILPSRQFQGLYDEILEIHGAEKVPSFLSDFAQNNPSFQSSPTVYFLSRAGDPKVVLFDFLLTAEIENIIAPLRLALRSPVA